MNILPKHNVASYFDIRVAADRDIIVVQGSPESAELTPLSGVVILCLTESISVRAISLKLTGRCRVSWSEPSYNSRTGLRHNKQDSVVYEKIWNFLPYSGGSKTLRAGNYEYPFRIMLPGNIPESVEGLQSCYVIYRLKATIDRTGLNSRMIKKKHIRLIRTLPPDAVEYTQTVSVDNTWPNKIEYTISIPTKAYAIGSYIPTHFVLVPLLKRLSIGKVTITLKEYITLHVAHGHNGLPASKDEVRTVRSLQTDEIEEYADHYELSKHLELPTSLVDCLQDCDLEGIKIRHKLKFSVSLRNPDGHVSELRAALPVVLMIPPQLFGDAADLESLRENFDSLNQPLPSYKDSMYDQLYDGLNYSNVETPLPSGATTPRRRDSTEPSQSAESHRRQLFAGLTALAQQQQPGDRRASEHSPSRFDDDYPSFSFGSNPSSGATSGAITRNPSETSLAELSRVPSYTEATRSSINALESPLQPSLPGYEDVTRTEHLSRPTSPGTLTPPQRQSSMFFTSPDAGTQRRSLDGRRPSDQNPASLPTSHSSGSLAHLGQSSNANNSNSGPHRPPNARVSTHRNALEALRRARMLPSSFTRRS
ncbi:arrestin/PY protein 1 [Schizosaccharomyces octosporus yFS286]|uniref:Arrestin/PY protein 1 n=1 Tax=Schizosaccharomyces octosporus (strain yFS286) TaxID=483514 RepID=S9Q102_SCHOY|nr:arrestin/PY protein 1 [Schizosaccharomyces octosporus yFS286]EPX74956.1 arrestin/PY protein 1 [Schizosaccharomyces octosporus yFS286]